MAKTDNLIKALMDPKKYLESFTKIKGKTPGLMPFILNDAQKDLFNTLNTSFRVIILKARQMGFCLSEDTKILTSNLEWVSLKDINIGDTIISVDENNPGERKQRKMKTAIVENKCSFESDGLKITLDNGESLIATKEHKMLSKKWECGTETSWKQIGNMKIGDSIRYITKPWGKGNYEDGWFGGMIDGEGSLSLPNRAGSQLTISQVEGPVFSRLLEYVQKNGITYRIEKDKRHPGMSSKLGSQVVYKVVISKMNELFEIFGKTRPSRFMSRQWWCGKALPNDGWTKIVSIERVENIKMVDLQTSEHTYIANGMVSHNSTAAVGYLYHKTITTPGTNTAIIGYNAEMTAELLDKVKTFYRTTPDAIRPQIAYNSKYEISFPAIDSKILVLPSSENVGRGYTLHNVLITELAFWDKPAEKMLAIENAVPANGLIIIESTPNGMGNLYHRMWMSSNDYVKKMYGWWWGYTEEQIEAFRRRINDPMRFAQEYELEFLSSGRPVFHPSLIKKLRKNVLKVGDMVKDEDGTDWMVQKNEDDMIMYYPPKNNRNYILGADVAEGVTGGDYSVFVIFDRKTGHEVAFWRGHMSPEKFGYLIDKCGRLYNNALSAVEINNHGLTTVTALKNKMYPQIYFRSVVKMDTMGSQISDRMGWKTTKISKPLMIDDLRESMGDGSFIIHTETSIDEMLTFVFDDGGNMVTNSGFHDDCIIANAIALQAFKVMYSGSLTQINYEEHLPSSGGY